MKPKPIVLVVRNSDGALEVIDVDAVDINKRLDTSNCEMSWSIFQPCHIQNQTLDENLEESE